MITDDDIFMIEEEEIVNGFKVKRVNADAFDVYRDSMIAFTGDDRGVAEFINKNTCVDCYREEANPGLDVCGPCYHKRIWGE